MSEGELKKRISLADGETKRWGSGYRTFIAKDIVDLIVDEARKEFPKKHKPSDWRGNKPPATYDTQEVDTWVLKYFGQKE